MKKKLDKSTFPQIIGAFVTSENIHFQKVSRK